MGNECSHPPGYDDIKDTTEVINVVNEDDILSQNFSCQLCHEILRDPIQCQNYEHYFCRECITRKLRNSQTCPFCADQLTLETLRPPSRIVARVVSQIQERRRGNIVQSCKESGEENAVVNGRRIFVLGGSTTDPTMASGLDGCKSVEVFDWSTETWSLMENFLFFPSSKSFSFFYEKSLMVCGGRSSERIEFFDPIKNGFTSTAFPGSLPSTGLKGVLFENRIITFGKDIQETSLERPWKSTVLVKGDDMSDRSACALECIGNDIFVIGFSGDKVERYDTTNKQLTALSTKLPYKVSNIATVVHEDSIIILGGDDPNTQSRARNDVLTFNIQSLECKRLPSMLQKRSGCAAVIMDDVIVVMGGQSKDGEGHTTCLKTVEYFVIGKNTWQELPAMNLGRLWPTACAYA